MPITFNCPQCRKKYRVEDVYGGRQWRCPTCSADITIPRADDIPVEAVDEGPRAPAPRYLDEGPRGPAPAPRRLYEGQPYEPDDRPSGSRELAPSWGTVRAGLTVLNTGLIIFLVALVIYILCFVMLLATARGGGGGRGLEAIVVAVSFVLGLSALALIILWFVGVGMCCASPSESGGKGLAVGSLICSVLSIVIAVGALVVLIALASGPRGGRAQEAIMTLIIFGVAWITSFVGFILFLFFMRAVAVFFGNNGLAMSIIAYFIVLMLFVVGGIALAFLMGAAGVESLLPRGANAAGAMLFPIVSIVGELLMLAWLTYLVGATRSSIPAPRPYGRRGDYY
jgi:hypothetical protein